MVARPLPVIANTFRTVLEWFDSGGQGAVNVTHLRAHSAGKTALQVFTALDAHVTQNMWDSVGSNASVKTVTITPLDGVTAAQSFNTASPVKWTGGGGATFTTAPAAIVKLQTGLRGPRHRGRLFLPFTSEAQADDGFLGPTVVTAMQTAWTAFLAAISADATTPCDLGVASYAHADFNAAVAATVEQPLGTQRRRQQRLRRIIL